MTPRGRHHRCQILHRLLAALFENGVGFVTTTNFQPDGLYLMVCTVTVSCLRLLRNQRMEVINVDNGTDYRRRTLEQVKLTTPCWGPQADAEIAHAFDQLAEMHDEDPLLYWRPAEIVSAVRRVAWCGLTFAPCAVGRVARMTIWKLQTQFHTVLLSDVPHMPVSMPSPARLTWLIDVLYDRRQAHSLGWQCLPERLYTEGPLVHGFRTVSPQ